MKRLILAATAVLTVAGLWALANKTPGLLNHVVPPGYDEYDIDVIT